MLKYSGLMILRLGSRNFLRNYSATGATIFKNTTETSGTVTDKNAEESAFPSKEGSGLLAAAFASLNEVEVDNRKPSPKSFKQSKTQQIDGQISKANDINSLLLVAENPIVSRRHALKVMKALQQKGRRSTPLLRALSFNITKQSEQLDLKKSADLLFSMASLNFPDPLLLDRICSDTIDCLPSNEDKPAVINSIIVSLGLLKHRHEAVLTALSEWLQSHRHICRVGDIASAVVTFATLDFIPPQTDSIIEAASRLKEEEMAKASSWLDLVYALLILERVEQHHLVSTLQPDFIDKLLSSGEIPIPSRRKLMSIDAYVGLKFPSNKIRLAEDISVGVPIMHTKEKVLYVQSIMDTFKSLVSAETFLRRDCQTGMGFLYDAEFAVDSKCHPVPLDKVDKRNDVHRIAVLALDYHDMSRGTAHPLGTIRLYEHLLTLKGYKVLKIPYTEFNPKDKLVTRVQYIESRLKELVRQSRS
ncbi:hypothetical protein KGM_210585 [Danaus plexippus plexippus]|uniref:RAP domain-containing protein n=1 Tax=Danaus plexippus plexippus TaxID=278856 RepID=A0A212F2H3_DANPL|nr:hypothetical protein KGM_210585 [Danaus plexippus plexippus]